MLKTIRTGLVLAMLLTPAAAFAERAEVDCNTLPDADVQKFYELSGEMSQAASEKRYEDALALAQKAMSMCTSDTYTEYMLARLYHLTNDCANAYYHYEILSNRPKSVKSENRDIFDELPKQFKQIKQKCGDVVTAEIQCTTPDTKLQISGLATNSTISCPAYMKIKPGSYPVIATKEGYMPAKETLTVPPEGGTFTIGELKEVGSTGYLRVRCPRGASKFVLTASNGTVEEYVCPWEGEVSADTYSIYLGGEDPKTATTVTVNKKERLEHVIPAATTTICSATPLGRGASFAGIFGVLAMAAAGFGVSRRRAQRAK